MAFYSQDPDLGNHLQASLQDLAQGRPGLEEQLSVTWLAYASSALDQAASLNQDDFWGLPLAGASHGGDRPRYPASVVKLFYGAALEAWLARDLLLEGPELRRALEDMLADSSNDATSLVLDLLTGSTSGPDLPEQQFRGWARQRQLVNDWFEGLGWPEWQGCNACQKTWAEGPYGRERQFYGADRSNRNWLSSDATARLLHGLIAGAWVSPPASARLRAPLSRSLDPHSRAADPENQVDGFLGGYLPEGSRLWSKAGWMSQARHDAAYVEVPGSRPFLLVAFSEGETLAKDEGLLPELCQRLAAALAD